MSEEKPKKNVERREYASVWMFFLGAIAVHALIILALSPSLYTSGEDTSPEGLLRKARTLEDEGKYEEAFKTYELLMAKKPQMPVVFEKGEKEMQQVRLKMLEQKRERERQTSGAKEEEKAEEEPTEGTETEGEAESEEETGEEAQPETGEDLPQLPGLE